MVKLRAKNVCFCHLSVFERQNHPLGDRNNYFVDVHKAFQFCFKRSFDANLVAISQLQFGNLKKDCLCNDQADSFCM